MSTFPFLCTSVPHGSLGISNKAEKCLNGMEKIKKTGYMKITKLRYNIIRLWIGFRKGEELSYETTISDENPTEGHGRIPRKISDDYGDGSRIGLCIYSVY